MEYLHTIQGISVWRIVEENDVDNEDGDDDDDDDDALLCWWWCRGC